MDTKGAIEFCDKEIKSKVLYSGGFVIGIEESPRDEKFNQIIKLLQRGEKYKKIVKEMGQFLEPRVITEIPEDMVGSRHIDIIKYTFEKIKQKYFSKGVK